MTDRICDNERFVLAFYGLDESPHCSEKFFEIAECAMIGLNCSPDKVGLVGKGFSGKVGDFKRGKSLLVKNGFAELSAFDVHATLPNARIPGMEFVASASFSRAQDDGGFAVIAFPSSSATKEVWSELAANIVRAVNPAYGIGYHRELAKGPVKFALGVGQNLGVGSVGAEYERARNVARWSDVGMPRQVYRKGVLRDVFPINFLNRAQLSRSVGILTLANWIDASETHGLLHPFAESLSLWLVGESELAAISSELGDGGLVFNWQDYVT